MGSDHHRGPDLTITISGKNFVPALFTPVQPFHLLQENIPGTFQTSIFEIHLNLSRLRIDIITLIIPIPRIAQYASIGLLKPTGWKIAPHQLEVRIQKKVEPNQLQRLQAHSQGGGPLGSGLVASSNQGQ